MTNQVQKTLIIREAEKSDLPLIREMIMKLAVYEKRPEDMSATTEDLAYWLFERKIATVLLAFLDAKPVGYALYYPIFGSFMGKGKIHLEDLLVNEEIRGSGLGRKLFSAVCQKALEEGYCGMEWSALDWNQPAIHFYDKLQANPETGRVYFWMDQKQMEEHTYPFE